MWKSYLILYPANNYAIHKTWIKQRSYSLFPFIPVCPPFVLIILTCY
jgi:hypothetical protein